MGDLKTDILYFGDNKDILRRYIPDASVDLIYLDPPFNSKKDYNMLGESGTKAFSDIWRWTPDVVDDYREVVGDSTDAGRLVCALHTVLGESSIMAYLAMMSIRLIELHRVLKPAGSLYLHCNPMAGHYLKLVLDQVFGAASFRNEIIWCYRQGGRGRNIFGRKHDNIFFYTKTDEWCFNADAVRVPYHGTGGYQTSGRGVTIEGKVYTPHPAGKIAEDWWDIPALPPLDRERLGFRTQKPLALLERIIAVSSNKNDIVLDPFCGCGTAVVAAQKLNRRWIGIDSGEAAIALTRARLQDSFGVEAEVIGGQKDRVSSCDVPGRVVLSGRR